LAPTNILRADNVRPVGTAKRRAQRAGEARVAVLRVGRIVLRVRLRATPTADRIWQQMPLYGTTELWGSGAVHIKTPVETGRELAAQRNVTAGEIAYWVEDDRIIIGFAATPLSKEGEIRMPSPVTVWADALDDVTALAAARPGERASLLHADS
jgi:uncharacterized protein